MRKALGLAVALALAALAAGCGAAPTAPAAADDEARCTEIVVTGSLIPQEVCETPAERAARERLAADDKRELERIQRAGLIRR